MNDLIGLSSLPGFSAFWKNQWITIPGAMWITSCSRGVEQLRPYCDNAVEARQLIESVVNMAAKHKTTWLQCIDQEWSKPSSTVDIIKTSVTIIAVIAVIGGGLWVVNNLLMPQIKEMRKKR